METETDFSLTQKLNSVWESPGFPDIHRDIQGTNIRTRTGERVGDGKYGPKASGMLDGGWNAIHDGQECGKFSTGLVQG